MLDNVIGRDDSSGLKMALVSENIDDMFTLLNLDHATIDSLTYDKSSTETNIAVSKGEKGLLKVFLDFVLHREHTGNPIGDDWTAVDQASFDGFRVDPTYLSSKVGATTPTSFGQSTSKYSPADLFRRGIKRDPTLFPTLKDEKYNDTWHRSFANQARAQDVADVLDPKYKPSTTEQRDLFEEKQKYLYAVLESKVLTDRGKAFIREHEKDYDAQAVYKKLTEHHLKSTKALIDSSAILSYITLACLGSGEWRGTTEAFIIHWQNQVRLYERQVPLNDHFSDGQKRTMLQNAVSPIDELRQVKNNADLEKTRTGKMLKYDEYVSLLLSAASAYDEQYKPKKNKRFVYAHDLFDEHDVDIPEDP